MLRNSFLLTLLVSGTQAVKLAAIEDDCILPSETEGPVEGFDSDLCDGEKPEEYVDPVCYEN